MIRLQVDCSYQGTDSCLGDWLELKFGQFLDVVFMLCRSLRKI